MTPGYISKRVIVERLALVLGLLAEIRTLPLDDPKVFFGDRRNVWAAESCLRRSLEALFDLGRHILAKGYGKGVSEYKEIGKWLQEQGILSEDEAATMRLLAVYRNRMVHFYHEISKEELYQICAQQLGDVELVLTACQRWLKDHPDKLDEGL